MELDTVTDPSTHTAPEATTTTASAITTDDATGSPNRPAAVVAPAGIVRPDLDVVATERRGVLWVFGSFLLCPCHLPLTLGVLAAVLGGTSLGALLRDHAWVAGTIITLAWVAGTAYGFRLLRRAQRTGGACPVREA